MTNEEKVIEIDEFLQRCEDWMHGEDSKTVTRCRKLLFQLNDELSKLHQPTVSICACGSNEYYVEQYKDVTKYYCKSCHEKISKH